MTIPTGFKSLPRRGTWKPATQAAEAELFGSEIADNDPQDEGLPPEVPTTDGPGDGFDEDGRLLLTEPLRPLPRPAPTILHPQPATRDRPTVRFSPGVFARISAQHGISPDDESTWR